RWLFAGLLPLVATAVLVVRNLPARRGNTATPRPDAGGFAAFTLATALILVWLTFAGHRFSWWSVTSGMLAAASIGAVAALVVQQRSSASPLLPVELLAEPTLRALAATVAINAGAMFGLVFFLPVMVQLGQGGDARAGGLAVLPLMLGTVISSLAGGRWIAYSGRVGLMPRWGLAWAAAMLLVLAVLMPRGATLAAITLALGLGLGTVMSNAQIMAQVVAGPERLGAAAALASLSRSLGATLGAAALSATVYGELARLRLSHPSSPEAILLLDALRHAFVGLSVLVLVGSLIARQLPVLKVTDQGDGPVDAG
ncbi:MAG TPA: MFS transporter, partial [Burkholderiaceae bacterium]|nr:MFS transporter [Burkholderiaceae bacterium]